MDEGLLSGTTAAMSGRLSVSFKSPLRGGIKEANAGGQGPQMLARRGYTAIVLDDGGGAMRSPKDPEKFKEANKRSVAGLRKHSAPGEGLPAFGTNVMTKVINEAGAYPTNNFALGRFDTAAKIRLIWNRAN